MVRNKSKIIKALTIGLVIAFLLLGVVLNVDISQSHLFTTRSAVLQITPIGTSIYDVRDIIDDYEHWRISSGSNERGFRRATLTDFVIIGDEFIRANVTRYGPFIFNRVGVHIFWGFDSYGNLTDVYVQRMILS